MPGYWWQCERGHRTRGFYEGCKIPPVFFMYLLAATDWDQRQLVVPCRECDGGAMRINYEFPRGERVQVAVHRIVGLTNNRPGYLPMMWETMPVGEPGPWFDFKYVGWSVMTGLQARGLARPAVFGQEGLREVFRLYARVAGLDRFP